MKKLILCLLSLTSLSGYASQTWDINDVSYLYPLPTSMNDSAFIKASDSIPYTWFSKDLADSAGYPYSVDSTRLSSTNLSVFTNLAKESFDRTRLLALRIDPCFQDLFTDPCRIQVRAVWQPMDKNMNSVDATIHTFYDLSSEEFMELTKSLKEIKAKYKISTTGLPLQVHPGFKQKGFTQDFSDLIKNFLKQDHITRIAFMKLNAVGLQWRFQGFNVHNGKLSSMEIPVRTGFTQTFSVHRGTLTYGSVMFTDEERARLTNGEHLYKVFLDYSARIENPKLNIPGTTDCLSCHASDGLKGTAAQGLGVQVPMAGSEITFMGKYNLLNTTGSREDFRHFRGFGYVDKKASISDRVIIESAMVAESMNLQNY